MHFFNFVLRKILSLNLLLVTVPVWAAEDAPRTPEIFAPIDTATKLLNMLIEGAVKYSFQVFAGIIILLIGWFAANFVARVFHKFLLKKKVDVTVAKFLVLGARLVIIIFAALVALGKFGIEIAPFVAGLSVVGFGTSFALQGPLSNYAAGVTLIFTKPFKVGDIMEVANVMGEVEDISLSRTQIKTVDDTTIVIPNKHIIGEIIHNYTEYKKLTLKISVGYNVNIEQAIQILIDITAAEKRVSTSRKARAGIEEFGPSAIVLSTSVWCRQTDYQDLLLDLNSKILAAFKKNKIEIPFPQRVVHLKKES